MDGSIRCKNGGTGLCPVVEAKEEEDMVVDAGKPIRHRADTAFACCPLATLLCAHPSVRRHTTEHTSERYGSFLMTIYGKTVMKQWLKCL
jgi:hypothetical protein